ncbi:MAG: glutamate-5-semialdehyde dehydrogenase [Ruminococcaceae bacterium]|nr:glutamate-5-semialdehyde dehydrogenase [Oscillospiraceae bacterium]
MNIHEYIEKLCSETKKASPTMATKGEVEKNAILSDIADAIEANEAEIIKANDLDLEAADKNGVPKTMLDRLKLTPERIKAIADAVREIVSLPDPVGKGEVYTNRDGLVIKKVRAPLGVVAIIFEARPNVTYDAAALCIKSGNAVILRGGKEAINSNRCAVSIMQSVLERHGVDKNAVSLVDDITREGTTELMQMRRYVDVIIPRGGKGLIQSVVQNSKIPCIETGAGNCHLYVEADADLDMALEVAFNAKCSRPSVCNAIETILVHKDIAEKFLPMLEQKLSTKGVELRACSESAKYFKNCTPATEEDYETEYNDFILAVKIVENVDEAIAHINNYGTGHSEAIITSSLTLSQKFQTEVDAAAVYVNASTRFTDGGVFGLGAEIGISTQKLHARGPMGLYEMTTTKYLINGNGQTR